MELLQTLLTVVFVISSILLIILILIQNSRSGGMGLFGGGAQTAFGASSGDILTKFTGILVGVFLVLAITLAYLKSQETGLSGIEKELNKTEAGANKVNPETAGSADKKTEETSGVVSPEKDATKDNKKDNTKSINNEPDSKPTSSTR